jgi:ABC-type glycerol-3-phosphate transport system permease component
MAKVKNKIREPLGDRMMELATTLILIFVLIIVGYPVIYVVSCSFSSANALNGGRVLLWPVEFSTEGYNLTFSYKDVWYGFRNTLFYTVASVLCTMTLQILMAYPLSKSNYQGKNVVLKILVIAMMTGAGLIPTFLLFKSLGLVGSPLAVVMSGAVGISNVFILRTSFKTSIPGELFDAARIDGANDFQCLVKIALPLAKATLSVLVLYSAVGCWNDYFTAMIYLPDSIQYRPLQLFLRRILMSTTAVGGTDADPDSLEAMQNALAQLKYAVIVVSTVPVLVLYGFVQKYFEKGVMIGSVKG